MSDSNSHSSLEETLLKNLQTANAVNNLVVALSGGLDSKVLLHALVKLRDKKLVNSIQAIHVNHGLQSISDEWQTKCQTDCQNYQVKLHTTNLNLAVTCEKNIEAIARDGRYHFFESIIGQNQWLLMAHHLDDQAETLLFRLLRGCGVNGARAMPKQRQLAKGQLLRPLLNVSRDEIQNYAKQQKIDWIDDLSNLDVKFSRNFLRHHIIPKIKEKWPGYAKTFNRFAQLASEQVLLLDEVASEDLLKIQNDQKAINIEQLFSLSKLRQKNILHFWGKSAGKLAPSSTEIDELLKQLSNSQLSSQSQSSSLKVNFAGLMARSFSNHLYLCSIEQPQPLAKKTQWLDISSEILLSNGLTLVAKKSTGKGLRKPKSHETIWVDARRGGEKCLADYRSKAAELKKIYQELQVPSWKREWLPIIYIDNEIAAIPGVFIAKKFVVDNSNESIDITIKDCLLSEFRMV